MSDTDEEVDAPVTEGRVREILDDALAPFKALLSDTGDDEEDEEEELPTGPLTKNDIEALIEERMAKAMKKLSEMSGKKKAAKPPPTPKTKVDPESDTDESESKSKEGEEQKPGPPGGTLKAKVQKAMGWSS